MTKEMSSLVDCADYLLEGTAGNGQKKFLTISIFMNFINLSSHP